MLAALAVVVPAGAQPAPATTTATAPATTTATAATTTATHGAPEGGRAAATVRIHDHACFDVLVERAGISAKDRAAEATKALERVADEPADVEVRVETRGDVAIVYAGTIPIIQLSGDDAGAAGDASLGVHADAVAAKTREALRSERQRSAVAKKVFSFSLLVFSALVAFLLLRKLDEIIERLRGWMGERPDRLPALRVGGIEVVRPAAVRGGVSVALTLAKRLAQVAVVYGWVIIALSLFESTRGYTARLTDFVVAPISALVGRVATALPLIVIAAVTVAVVGAAMRFVRLFFGSVARGETTVGWLPPDLAPATSVLIRAGLVVVTLVVAAPLITGTDEGSIARVGAVALGALGLASTPLLATAAAGIAVMYGGRLRAGEHVVVGGRAGRVRATTLLEVVLEDEDGAAIHVPHLLGLWHPTRVLGPAPPLSVEITVAVSADLRKAAEALQEAAAGVGVDARVELASLADGAVFRVTVQPTAHAGAKNRLLTAAATALYARGIALGRAAT
ncbi:MAG: mechanosensitive ion channel [Minicystis sp.]